MNRFNMRSQFDFRDDLLQELTNHPFLVSAAHLIQDMRTGMVRLAGRVTERALGAAQTAAAGS